MRRLTKGLAVLCLLEDPTPIAYLNVYDMGDVWVKIRGCGGCPLENRKKCCGNCPMFSERGCFFHLEDKKSSSKPYHCVTRPTPSSCASYCQLEFKCVEGGKKGKIRRVREPGNIFG